MRKIKKSFCHALDVHGQKDCLCHDIVSAILSVELSQLAVRTEYLFDFVLIELNHEVTCRSAVLTRVELTRFLSEHLTHSCCESKT